MSKISTSLDFKDEWDENEMLTALQEYVDSFGGRGKQRRAAQALGMSVTHLNSVLAGSTKISVALASKFGRSVGRTYKKE